MPSYIQVRDLCKSFGGGFRRRKKPVRAVDSVSFDIERNTVFGLVGESGCGKTTLSRAFLYLEPPDSGSVVFDGVSLGSLGSREFRRFRRRMQIVFQDPDSALNPRLRIASSLREGLSAAGIKGGAAERRIDELLDLVGIPKAHRTRFPHEFSGGQKQRIVIARALSVDPEFLILDEPVSNLDVSIQAQIVNLLLDLKDELGLTYLFISHDLNLVSYLSDTVAVMKDGRIVETGTAEQVAGGPIHPYTKKLYAAAPGSGLNGDLAAAGIQGGEEFRLPPGFRFDDGQPVARMLDAGGGHMVLCSRK